MKEMLPHQRQLAHALLSTGLEQRRIPQGRHRHEPRAHSLGAREPRRKARPGKILHLDLRSRRPRTRPGDGASRAITSAMNFTVADGKLVSGTPSFFGANPGVVLEGPRKGLRVLGREEDLGRALVKSLNKEQAAVAIVGDKAPKDIFTTLPTARPRPWSLPASPPRNSTRSSGPCSSPSSANTSGTHRPELAREDMDRIPRRRHGQGHLRVDGQPREKGRPTTTACRARPSSSSGTTSRTTPTTRTPSWRDFDGDFGEDLLAEAPRRGTRRCVRRSTRRCEIGHFCSPASTGWAIPVHVRRPPCRSPRRMLAT